MCLLVTSLVWCWCCRHNNCWTDKGNYGLGWFHEFISSRTRYHLNVMFTFPYLQHRVFLYV